MKMINTIIYRRFIKNTYIFFRHKHNMDILIYLLHENYCNLTSSRRNNNNIKLQLRE